MQLLYRASCFKVELPLVTWCSSSTGPPASRYFCYSSRVIASLKDLLLQGRTSIGHLVQLLYRASCFKVGLPLVTWCSSSTGPPASRYFCYSSRVIASLKNLLLQGRTSIGHVVQLLYRASCFKVELPLVTCYSPSTGPPDQGRATFFFPESDVGF